MDSGVATRPIADFDAYREPLTQFVYHSGLMMKPVFAAAKRAPSSAIVYAEGEDERVLRAVQVVVDEGWRADVDRPSCAIAETSTNLACASISAATSKSSPPPGALRSGSPPTLCGAAPPRGCSVAFRRLCRAFALARRSDRPARRRSNALPR